MNAEVYILPLPKESESAMVVVTGSTPLLDLSRQQRNLLLLRPLFHLELNKSRIGDESTKDRGLLSDLDTNYLVLSALDFMMESTTVSSGCTQQDMLRHLAELAGMMKSGLTGSQRRRVAEVVLDALDNKANNYKEFSYEYFDAPSRSMRQVRFRLVAYEPDMEDSYRYKPTPEGYLVYLGMLDMSPEDSQELMGKMLDLVMGRGQFDKALEIAKRARTLSIEYRQLIRDRLTQAYRAPGSVNWTQDVDPRLKSARTHVRARQGEDLRMEESVRDSLGTSEEFSTRQSLALLLSTLQGASLIRTKLVADISGSSERFLEAQRAVFRARRPSGLPDLETRLLPELMSLPTEELSAEADFLLSGLYPATWPGLVDLNVLFSSLLERREKVAAPENDNGDITPYAPPDEQFPPALQAEVEDWVRRQFVALADVTIEELLKLAMVEQWAQPRLRCLVMLLFRAFSHKESPFPATSARIDGRFNLPVAEGSNLIFSRGN